MKINTKKDRRVRIGLRQRKRIAGTNERPRLRVFRSVSHIYAQVIDDASGKTIASAASTEPALKPQLGGPARAGNKAGAQVLGKTIAERLIEKGIKRVVFDRGGFLYHGRIKAVAEAAREAGLEFEDASSFRLPARAGELALTK
jgi:large subunit ribosomal protein L18